MGIRWKQDIELIGQVIVKSAIVPEVCGTEALGFNIGVLSTGQFDVEIDGVKRKMNRGLLDAVIAELVGQQVTLVIRKEKP